MTISKFYYPNASYRIHVDTDAENTAIAVIEESTVVYSIQLDNSANAASSFLKIYNTTAAITVGTTDPTDEYFVPASVSRTFVFPGGKTFANGFHYACLTTAGTAGTTSPTSAAILRVCHSA